jgi:hypothetical protein
MFDETGENEESKGSVEPLHEMEMGIAVKI